MSVSQTMVAKRNGDTEPFVLGRIALAVFKAAQAQRPPMPPALSRTLGAQVSWAVEKKFHGVERVGIEEIQDAVVLAVREAGQGALADAYQAYREEHMLERARIAQSKNAERGFRLESSGGMFEISRDAWASALQEALSRGAKGEVAISKWWAAAKERAMQAKTVDDFIGSHILAILELGQVQEREEWLPTASALILERWRIRLCEAGPLLSGTAEARKAMMAHYKQHWAKRRAEQKSAWFPSVRETDAIAKLFDCKWDHGVSFAGLAMLEKAFGHGDGALLPQEIFANVAISICYGYPMSAASPADKLSTCCWLWEKFASGALIPPMSMMRQSRNASPSMSQEARLELDDSMEGIFNALAKTASTVKSGAAVSVDISSLRAEGSPIGADGQSSSGIAPVLRLFAEAFGMLKGREGEKQKGRISLACWHRDLEAFLAFAKIAPKSMRLAAGLSDAFMKKVFEGGDWVLASPSEAPRLVGSKGAELEKWAREYAQMARFGGLAAAKAIPAREVFRWICECIASASGPSVYFPDACIPYDDPSNAGFLSSRMAVMFSGAPRPQRAMELGINVQGRSREEVLGVFVEAHRILERLGDAAAPVMAALAPVGEMGREDFAHMLADASKMLAGGQPLGKGALWRSPNPWAARLGALEASRGGYVEREEDEPWEAVPACGRADGPARLVSMSAREEYLAMSGANPIFANHGSHRRQAWFEGLRVGFGGSGDSESVKAQAKRASNWQKWSDGAVTFDVKLSQASAAEVGEAIKLAWLRGLPGVRRFIGARGPV